MPSPLPHFADEFSHRLSRLRLCCASLTAVELSQRARSSRYGTLGLLPHICLLRRTASRRPTRLGRSQPQRLAHALYRYQSESSAIRTAAHALQPGSDVRRFPRHRTSRDPISRTTRILDTPCRTRSGHARPRSRHHQHQARDRRRQTEGVLQPGTQSSVRQANQTMEPTRQHRLALGRSSACPCRSIRRPRPRPHDVLLPKRGHLNTRNGAVIVRLRQAPIRPTPQAPTALELVMNLVTVPAMPAR